jgi:hypothetical protein
MKQIDRGRPPNVVRPDGSPAPAGGSESADRRSDLECPERGVTVMTQLDTEPMTHGLRAGRSNSDAMAVLIRVPRVDEPCDRVRTWRAEEAARFRPAMSAQARRSGTRPRRRLRREVRLAAMWILALATLGVAFTMGWMTRGTGPLDLRVLTASAQVHHPRGPSRAPEGIERPDDGPQGESDTIAIGPAIGAPVADAEVPVVFPGYLLPDDSLQEPAHEGS